MHTAGHCSQSVETSSHATGPQINYGRLPWSQENHTTQFKQIYWPGVKSGVSCFCDLLEDDSERDHTQSTTWKDATD